MCQRQCEWKRPTEHIVHIEYAVGLLNSPLCSLLDKHNAIVILAGTALKPRKDGIIAWINCTMHYCKRTHYSQHMQISDKFEAIGENDMGKYISNHASRSIGWQQNWNDNSDQFEFDKQSRRGCAPWKMSKLLSKATTTTTKHINTHARSILSWTLFFRDFSSCSRLSFLVLVLASKKFNVLYSHLMIMKTSSTHWCHHTHALTFYTISGSGNSEFFWSIVRVCLCVWSSNYVFCNARIKWKQSNGK